MTTPAGCAATSSASSHEPDRTHEPSASVVICAYTDVRWPQIVRAVDSVLTQQRVTDELILVVDHEEALRDRARAAFVGVTVVASTGPRGLSGARNTGVELASNDVVVFLDDDAEAEPDWLCRLLRHYRDPDVLAVGGRAVPAWEGSRPRWFPPEFDWVVGCNFTGQPTHVSPVRNVIGCNMSFRRDALIRTGGFNPALGRVGTVPVGCEETELCIRLRHQHPDCAILYDPQAVVRHVVTAGRATWRYFRRRCVSEGRSKAVVARLAGREAALSAEREYTRRTLPAALWRELRASVTGKPVGLLRAGAIVAGLALAASSYVLTFGRRTTRTGVGDAALGGGGRPEPVRILTVDLADDVPAVSDTGRTGGGRYGSALILVRLHGQPLGVLRADLPPGGLPARAHGALIERELAPAIEEHLRRDGAAATYRARHRDQAPFVTVVVPTSGRQSLLRRTLDGLGALDYPRYEVVVVDNVPTRTDTAALVAERAERDERRFSVRYTAEPRQGVTHARNRGLAEARGEIVAFADDDVLVDRRWLWALVDGFTDESVAAVTGCILPSELETPAQVWVEQYGGFGKGSARRRFDAAGYDVLDAGQVTRVPVAAGSLYPYLPGTYGSGANMAFRTEILRRLGGFDPLLGSPTAVRAGEDIDVLLRLVLAGHTLVYEPAAIVWHAHKRDLPALRRTMYHYGMGLSAVTAKSLWSDRVHRRDLLRRLPRGIVHALNPHSAKNAGRQRGYPVSLVALELCGMALGPAYYARAAWAAARRERRTAVAAEEGAGR